MYGRITKILKEGFLGNDNNNEKPNEVYDYRSHEKIKSEILHAEGLKTFSNSFLSSCIRILT